MTDKNFNPPPINGRMFIRRFTKSTGKSNAAILSNIAARIAAEDANTAFYVQHYQAGNYSCREDYIAYLANRIEFEFKKIGVKS